MTWEGTKKPWRIQQKKLDHIVGQGLEKRKQVKISGEVKDHQDFMDVMLSNVADDDDETSSMMRIQSSNLLA